MIYLTPEPALFLHDRHHHPFLDGNKRAGIAVAALFLQVNGYRLTAQFFPWQVIGGNEVRGMGIISIFPARLLCWLTPVVSGRGEGTRVSTPLDCVVTYLPGRSAYVALRQMFGSPHGTNSSLQWRTIRQRQAEKPEASHSGRMR